MFKSICTLLVSGFLIGSIVTPENLEARHKRSEVAAAKRKKKKDKEVAKAPAAKKGGCGCGKK